MNPTWRIATRAVTALACVAALGAAKPSADAVTVGEGLTAADRETHIAAGSRMFSLPMMPKACAGKAHVRLVAFPARLQMKVGKSYRIDELLVRAVDAAGRTVAAVPVAIDVAVNDKELLKWPEFAFTFESFEPLRAGTFRIDVRAICEGVETRVGIPVTVTR
jgi:hypothetical protein